MPSIMKTAGVVAGLAAVACALPAYPKLNARQENLYSLAKRQNAAAAALGLQDVDILQLYVYLTVIDNPDKKLTSS